MSSSKKTKKKDARYTLLNPLPKHFDEIRELCKRVYPFSKPWSLEQLESHRSYFPDGQLIVIDHETQRVVGMAFSLIISWHDYSPQDNWGDFTSGGFFHNHNPREGKTLYGAEVMVDPECRGRGIGKMLYKGRQKIVEKYQLKRIRAGARLRGYSKFKDKLTPQDYVRQVIQKKIYDPTLSFQINQGFKVIDVAPNYLFNDPESLGYAAVIEWLNPEKSTATDLKKQKHSVDLFLNDEKFVPQFLPRELRQLVRKVGRLLGRAILESEGKNFYQKVEFYREKLKKTRNNEKSKEILENLFLKLSKNSKDELIRIAHAFSLHLELVNLCEAAYRTWKQRQKNQLLGKKRKIKLTYVLTAHPTEARPKEFVDSLSQLQGLLVDSIHNKFVNENSLATQVRKIWLQSIVKKKRPSVLDEAEYIFSLVFSFDILDFILHEKSAYDLELRTWVGGDKDGHPGVDKETMKKCLNKSRLRLIDYASHKLKMVLEDLVQLESSRRILNSEAEAIRTFIFELKNLNIIAHGDGTKIKKWKFKYNFFLKKASFFIKTHENIIILNRLLDFFPAFVLPIELREDAGIVEKALYQTHSPIRGMLSELTKISGVLELSAYVRGFVISHCENERDIANACKLVDSTCHNKNLRVIPLFETREALSTSSKIVKNWLKLRSNYDRVHRHWLGNLEVMLGYSDSAKQMGVLPSRLLIAKAMWNLDRVLKEFQIKAIFFQGSGGSIARGGGSFKEQISWWSPSAIENPKMTIQGEMVQRSFASKEILNSQCSHLMVETLRRRVVKVKLEKNPVLDSFANQVSEKYMNLVNNSSLLNELLEASPYRYLERLKIGSRPVNRPSSQFSLSSLRAIPWVLCWTQTRSLLPTWWGIGSVWKKLKDSEKESLKLQFKKDPFFSSFVKTLGFTLAKVELAVWELYFPGKERDSFFKRIREEYLLCIKFIYDISGEKKLIWYRPWLEESIRLRSSYIHILNLIQIHAMRKSDEDLLRETIVGIACGMLTTG